MPCPKRFSPKSDIFPYFYKFLSFVFFSKFPKKIRLLRLKQNDLLRAAFCSSSRRFPIPACRHMELKLSFLLKKINRQTK